MTTIVYKDGALFSDSMGTTAGWSDPAPIQKMFRLHSGAVAAMTGDIAIGREFIRWLNDEIEHRPDLGEDARVIVATKSCITVYEGTGSFDVRADAKFLAWGSGMPPALGALHAGATGYEAIIIASKVDPGTNNDVKCMVPF